MGVSAWAIVSVAGQLRACDSVSLCGARVARATRVMDNATRYMNVSERLATQGQPLSPSFVYSSREPPQTPLRASRYR